MKKLLLLPFMLLLLMGCNVNDGKLTFSEINPEKASATVKDFITQMEINEDGTGNGIYILNVKKDKFYLFLSQEFLDKGKSFGSIDVKEEEDTLTIYLNERSDKGQENQVMQKLYEIHRPKDYEFLRVFKNGEETHIQTVGA
ncbi:hypothetical protein ACFFHH_13535 [Cytobacillus solani]|uniref:Lipoprotein n=1 Tax=Cytobacillus solani TaxID=1637975 RepID=A0A0Q3VJZ8_9BACI|nr:hypothetical protein [Cytobacillus solani]KQL21426.1 hypothetical protein AN957_24655 [Cytobacillus solani]USK54727.1 hypothetical protein LIS82_24835 [Cytobacillus solani]